jgi:hypothetical protein
LKGAHHIQVKETTKPFTFTPPRKIAIPLLSKVKAELQDVGVISKVE